MYDFFQAVRLLEKHFAGGKSPGETADVGQERIRFRPHNGLAFPATDVRSIERLEGTSPCARVTVTFMGLYGVDSPLPVYFYDSIATESDESKPLRDFLDIFNHRIYALFYNSWKKYRAALQYATTSAGKVFQERLLSIAGLGAPKAADSTSLPPMRLAAFAGILAARARNAEGLQHIVTELLNGVRTAVLENIPRWVTIPRRPRIGRSTDREAVLGSTACIGTEVIDFSGMFRLVLGPLSLEQYLSLLPGGAQARRLQFLVRLYVRDYLDYDTELKLRVSDIPALRLSDRTARLGLTTWLGPPAGETTSRIVAYS